ncbi:MAG: 4-(cytidine 5'-diphospho)-2-C-methyl-D-erythritol kinase [Chitinophagaceae bacterium]
MIAFPNCKINLGLSIINKRNDGYHNLETIFYPLAFTDALEIIRDVQSTPLSTDDITGSVTFSASGTPVPGDNKDNLCMKAYPLLQEDYPGLPSLKMHLHKAIPMGAGLGGGSADGAFVLTLLNTLFNLGLSSLELINYASKLGSDCPFFIINTPCFATGRGEILEPVSLDLSRYSFMLVNCGITVNTGWAFSQIDTPGEGSASKAMARLKDIILQPVSTWKDLLINDFELPVFKKYPEIKLIKDQLYDHGALYASMSGSGSSVFGIFEKNIRPNMRFPAGYHVFSL